MKKRYTNKQGDPVNIRGHIKMLDGKVELNPSALSDAELFEKCGLYLDTTPQLHDPETECYGDYVFDDTNGTCARGIFARKKSKK